MPLAVNGTFWTCVRVLRLAAVGQRDRPGRGRRPSLRRRTGSVGPRIPKRFRSRPGCAAYPDRPATTAAVRRWTAHHRESGSPSLAISGRFSSLGRRSRRRLLETPGCPCWPRPDRRAWPPGRNRQRSRRIAGLGNRNHLAAGSGLHLQLDRRDRGALLVEHHQRILAVLEPALRQIQAGGLDLLRITPQVMPIEPHRTARQAVGGGPQDAAGDVLGRKNRAVEGGRAVRGGHRLPGTVQGARAAAHLPRSDGQRFASDGELDGAEKPLAVPTSPASPCS